MRVVAAVIVVLALLAVGIAGPPLLREHVKSHVQVKPEKVDIDPRRAEQVAVDLRVRNDTGIAATLHSADYVVLLAGREVGSGTWTAPEGGLRVESGTGTVLPLTLHLDPRALLGSALALMRSGGGRPDASVRGTVRLSALGLRIERAIERPLGPDAPR